MEQNMDIFNMLDLMTYPAFCVENGIITQVNEAARKRTLAVGSSVSGMLVTGVQEYADLQDGCLHLTLSISGIPCGASVKRIEGRDIFWLEQDESQSELQVLALAAQELRQPLTSIMTAADNILPEQASPAEQEQLARIYRGLLQMQRMVSNMSDAYRYCQDTAKRQETRNISGIFDEIFTSVAPLVQQAGLQLSYTGLNDAVYCLVDEEMLERAIHNILSNAIKFSPAGGVVDVKLTRKNHMLYLTVSNSGTEGSCDAYRNVYNRYLREPGLEDSRCGIGLGLVLIRTAAAAHGGTVLMEQSPDRGTRLTMTLSIRQSAESIVRSKVLQVDYAGGQNHRLMELSESLPLELYRKETLD